MRDATETKGLATAEPGRLSGGEGESESEARVRVKCECARDVRGTEALATAEPGCLGGLRGESEDEGESERESEGIYPGGILFGVRGRVKVVIQGVYCLV